MRRRAHYNNIKTTSTLLHVPSSIILTMNILHVNRHPTSNLSRHGVISNVPRRATKMSHMSIIRVTRRDPYTTHRRHFNRQLIRTIHSTRRLANLKMSSNVTRLTQTMHITRRVHYSAMGTIRLSSTIDRRIGTMSSIFVRHKHFYRRSSKLNPNILPRHAMTMDVMNAINTRSTRVMFIRPTRIQRNRPNIRHHTRTRTFPRTLRVKVVQGTKTIRHVVRNVVGDNATSHLERDILPMLPNLHDLPSVINRKRLNTKDTLDGIPQNTRTIISNIGNRLIRLIKRDRRSTTRRTTTMNGTSRPILLINTSKIPSRRPLPNRLVRLHGNHNRPFFPKRLLMFITTNRNHRDNIYLLRLNNVIHNRNELYHVLRLTHSIYHPYNKDRRDHRRRYRYTSHTRGSVTLFLRMGAIPPEAPKANRLPPQCISF